MTISARELAKETLPIIFLMLTGALFCLLLTLFPGSAPAEAWHQLDGNAEDVKPQLVGPAYDLGGGGTDVDQAIQWMVNQVRGRQNCSKTVDLVVLRFLKENDQEAWNTTGKLPKLDEYFYGYNKLIC